MGFSGRCEAIKAPTTENDTIWARRVATGGPDQARKISPRVRPLRRARIRPATPSATHTRHSDQASHAAVRRLIPPTPRSCSLAPSVTTPLYNTTVSQPLRQTLRGEVPIGYLPVPATHEDMVVPEIFRCRTQAVSPVSVLMVNIILTPSQRPLRASLTVSAANLMDGYSRNLRGDSHASSLTILQPWLRPSRTG